MDTRGIALGLAFALGAAAPVLAQKRLAACDLMNRAQASAMLRGPVVEHVPNRDIEQAGKVAASHCVFAAARSNLRLQLFEYPNAVAAIGAARQVTTRGGEAAYTEEKGLGDQAWWWSIGSHARGYFIRKGSRILVLDVRSAAPVDEKTAKELLRSGMPALVARL